MALSNSLSLKLDCMLRRMGLSGVSRTALACIALVCAALLAYALWRFWPASASSSEDFEVQTDASVEETALAEDGEATTASSEIYVDVEGAVEEPGVYVLQEGDRVNDAVEAAGGLTKKASRQSVNLAEELEDGMQVYVYSKSEVSSGSSSSSSTSSSSSSSASSADSSEKININTATAEELQELSGVGEVIAGNIVAYREENGNFTSIEQIQEVSGIGEARFAAIEEYICV